MYNGIGLQTARGTGTNGYVMRNLSHINQSRKDNKPSYDYNDTSLLGGFESSLVKKPNKDILDHNRKRNIEVKCLELQEELEEEGYGHEYDFCLNYQ